MLGHNRCDQRRQHQHVRNVVAVIGHQHRLLARQDDDIADGVLLDLKFVHLQRVSDKLSGAGGRSGRVRGVGHIAHQLKVAVELLGELLARQRALARSQQRRTAEVHGVCRTGIVNAYHQIGGDAVNRRRQPCRTDRFNRIDRFAPLRYMVVQVVHQRDWLAEVHIALTKVTQLAEAAHHLQQALFLFRRTAQLFGVGADLHHMLVTDIDRYQRDRARAAAQHRLDGHRQGTGFRIEQTPGARAAALNEILYRITTAEQLAQVFTEHRRVELVAFKGTANKEGAKAAENRTGGPEVEVDPGRNMRWHQSLVVKHVGEQQVVHVAAVAGHIDNFMALVRQLAYALGVVHVDPLIEPVPRKAEDTVGQANHLVREVSGNLFHQRDSVLLRLIVGDLFAARFIFHRTGNRFRRQQLIEEILTRRQAWANGGQTLAGEVHTRHARQFLRDDLIRAVFGRHAAQRNRRGEAHKAVAAKP